MKMKKNSLKFKKKTDKGISKFKNSKQQSEKIKRLQLDDEALDYESNESDQNLQESFLSSDEEAEDNTTSSEDKKADDSNSEEENDEDEVISHKKSLEKLKHSDPDFYKFLQENDQKLLNFNLSDSEGDDDDETDKFHKPDLDGELEIASDESDYEPDEADMQSNSRVITLKMIKKWRNELQTDKSNVTIGNVVKAFHSALLNISTPDEEESESHYIVKGSAVFNAVIQLCVLDLGPAIRRFLGIETGSKVPPHKCKRFVKIKTILKSYFTNLLKLLSGVTSTNILTVLLKHLHYMSPMLTSYPSITKPLLKKLIQIWSTSAESVRVVAFLCILRITTNQQSSVLDYVLKSMYLAYVKNSKFVSTNTLSVINFMKRSLVEMFALDCNVSYQHVFLYVRQLAIHLRNAIVVKKKENLQAVYNWQYVNSLRLWGNLFAVTVNKQQMKQLIYPFVQVCLGTLKLVPTAQYFPLRFHVCKILIELTRDTGIFIPILPFILEVLNTFDFNKKHTKVSMKPLQFTSILRLSKSQLAENGFKDTCIETIYGHILEYLSIQSCSIAFPDLSLFCTLQLKQFIKKCSISNYSRKIKQLLEKINQNSEYIEKERQKVSFNLSNMKEIEAWETIIRNKGTPLITFYDSWHKMVNMKKRKQETGNDELGDYKLPTIKRIKKTNNEAGKETEAVTLFPSDSESDGEDISFTKGDKLSAAVK